MPRLGELLVAGGVLTAAQVEQALRAQVMWGARFGTNLIELGFLDLDRLSTALGQQLELPAALARHFERVEAAVQGKLPAAVAEAYACIPLFTVPGEGIVVASSSPLSPPTRANIAEALGVTAGQIIPAIAAELRIRYQLERIYKVQRSARFMRSPGKTIPPFPALVIDADGPDGGDSEPAIELVAPGPAVELEIEIDADGELTLPPIETVPAPAPAAVETAGPVRAGSEAEPEITIEPGPAPVGAPPAATLDELTHDNGIPDAPLEDTTSGRERRTYVKTIADARTESERRSLGRIAIRRVAIGGPAPDAPPGPIAAVGATTSLPEATRAIRRAPGRDLVVEHSLDALERFVPTCEAAAVLVLRGQIATSWLGFCRSAAAQAEIVVPLDQPGLVERAARDHRPVRAAAGDLPPLDQLLLVSLGGRAGELAVVPILVAGQVMCVLAMVVEVGAPLAAAEAVAGAAGAAFARLMRDASR